MNYKQIRKAAFVFLNNPITTTKRDVSFTGKHHLKKLQILKHLLTFSLKFYFFTQAPKLSSLRNFLDHSSISGVFSFKKKPQKLNFPKKTATKNHHQSSSQIHSIPSHQHSSQIQSVKPKKELQVQAYKLIIDKHFIIKKSLKIIYYHSVSAHPANVSTSS